MDARAFEDMLDTYGADPARWPSDTRAEAEALLATSAEARAHEAAMADVETFLRSGSLGAVPHADPSSVTNMAAIAMRHRQVKYVSPTGRKVRWGAAFAAALVLGVAVGHVRLDAADSNPDQVVAIALEGARSFDVD